MIENGRRGGDFQESGEHHNAFQWTEFDATANA